MKKILFFAAMFVVALCSTALISCGNDSRVDDPKEEEKPHNYGFNLNAKLADDILKVYKDVTVTIEIPGEEPQTIAVTKSEISATGKGQKGGTVKVTFNGTLRTDIVEDATDYNTSVTIYVSYGGNSTTKELTSSSFGSQLKEHYTQLSNILGMKFTYQVNL